MPCRRSSGPAGEPVNVETLGGYLLYKYGNVLPADRQPVVGPRAVRRRSPARRAGAAWSCRGDAAVAPTRSRSRSWSATSPALDDRGAGRVHRLLIVGGTFAGLPGDEISTSAAAGYALWLGLSRCWPRVPWRSRSRRSSAAARRPASPGRSCSAGSSSTAYAGRCARACAAGRPHVVGLDGGPLPLAGVFDWPSLGLPVALVTVALLVVGVEAFDRRDIGATGAVPPEPAARPRRAPRPDRPGRRTEPADVARLGPGAGPVRRSLIAGSGSSFIEQIGESPEFVQLLSQVFPGIDIGSARRVPAAPLSSSSGLILRASPRRRSSPAGRPTRHPAGSSSCWRRRCRGSAG